MYVSSLGHFPLVSGVGSNVPGINVPEVCPGKFYGICSAGGGGSRGNIRKKCLGPMQDYQSLLVNRHTQRQFSTNY